MPLYAGGARHVAPLLGWAGVGGMNTASVRSSLVTEIRSQVGEVRLERSLTLGGHLLRLGGCLKCGSRAAQVPRDAMARVEVENQSFYRFWWRPKLVAMPPALESILSPLEYGSVARRFEEGMRDIGTLKALRHESCSYLAGLLACLLLEAVSITWWLLVLLDALTAWVWWSSWALLCLWIAWMVSILLRMAYFLLAALEELRREAYEDFAVDASLGCTTWRLCDEEGVYFEVQAAAVPDVTVVVVDEIPEVGDAQPSKVGKMDLEPAPEMAFVRQCFKCGARLKALPGCCDGCGHRV